MSLTALLGVFSLMSRGVLWLVIMLLMLVASALVMRPAAASWFDGADPVAPDA